MRFSSWLNDGWPTTD
ncbi:hypothetical protein D018_3976A, partial [Vibrio parahaemolyticus VP2007-007]